MICRVHWLLWELSYQFKGYYKLLYNYETHRYCFYRNYLDNNSKRLKEVFIVIRTSKRCYRMMYYNHFLSYFTYESFRSARTCARRMQELGFPRFGQGSEP